MNEVSSINLRKIRIINNIDGSVEFGTASYIKLILVFKRYFDFCQHHEHEVLPFFVL